MGTADRLRAAGVTPWIDPGWGDLQPAPTGRVQDRVTFARAGGRPDWDPRLGPCANIVEEGPRGRCIQLCWNILRDYPVSPDGCWYVSRQPDGTLWLHPLPCLSPDCPDPHPLFGKWETKPLTAVPTVGVDLADGAAVPVGQAQVTTPLAVQGAPPIPFGAGGAGIGPGFTTPPTGGGRSIAGVDIGTIESVAEFVLGGKVDLAGVVRAVLALVLSSDRIRGTLDQLGPQLGERFVPVLESLALNTLQGNRELAALLVPAFQQTGTAQTEATQGLAGRLLAGLVEVVGDILEALKNAAAAIFGPLVGEARNQIGTLAAAIERVFREDLEKQRHRLPKELDKVAGDAIGAALLAGTTAQVAAMGLELLHPTKRIGTSQIVGFLADFAGFGDITGPWHRPTVQWSIGNLADQRAAQMFRTNLPSPGEMADQARQYHVPLSDYAQNLALHGFPSPWIKVLVDDVYRDPSMLELVQLLDDGELDPAWVTAKVREIGYDPGDVQRATRAILLRATRTGRGRWINEALAGFRDGHIGERELDAVLRDAGLIALHRDVYVRSARLDRRGRIMERLAARVLDQFVNDITTMEAAREQLRGLGFVAGEVTMRLLEADLRREVKQIRDEETVREAEIRQLTTAAFENLRRQFRAGFVQRAEFLAWGMALGLSEGYVENVADVELLRGPPAAGELLPPIGLGAVQEAAREMQRLLTDEVRAGRVDVGAALVLLQELNVDRGLARELLGVAQVLGLPVPGPLGLAFPSEDPGRAAFEAIMATVIEQIRRGDGGTGLLDEVLARIGLPVEHRRPARQILETLEALFFRPAG